jgi:hypothetical protein
MLKEHFYKGASSLLAGLALIFGAAITAQAQLSAAPVKSVGDTVTCYVGDSSYERIPDKRLLLEAEQSSTSNQGIQSIFNKVSSYTHLVRKIYTVPVRQNINVEICPGDRGFNYILYSPTWMRDLYYQTNTRWALYAIIAHEIGHYVLAHDRTTLGSNPRIELEADEYAGEILAAMGARWPEAEAAFKSPVMQTDKTNHTHPPTDRRLLAVKRGWEGFRTKNPMFQVHPLPQAHGPLQVDINGQQNTVFILFSSEAAGNTGRFKINENGGSTSFLLERDQTAEVNLIGNFNKVYVSQEIYSRVKVNDLGQNNKVYLR